MSRRMTASRHARSYHRGMAQPFTRLPSVPELPALEQEILEFYNGHALYRYTGDAKPGDTNGQRVRAFGAAWFAVSGAGQVVSRPASKPGGGSMY